MKRSAIEAFLVGILWGVITALVALAWVFLALPDPKKPDIFDSMLCSIHTPVGAILVNSELVKCTNGKVYRWTGKY